MTGQEHFDGYGDSAVIALGLVNELAVGRAYGRRVDGADRFAAVHRVLEVDPPSAAQLRDDDLPGFVALAAELRAVFDDVRAGAVDAAADRLNRLLAAQPAHPHLAKDGDRWVLHHHPVDAELVPMATAVSAEVLARVIGDGAAHRLGTCDSDDCDRVFLDGSKNGSRRFCSTTCQNRVKAAAFRRRRATTASD